MNITFDQSPWPWHATDLMLSTLSQIVPVLLIAVAGLAILSHSRVVSKSSQFWFISSLAVYLVGIEGWILYQMGIREELRVSFGFLFVLAFVLPTVISLVAVRSAVYPTTDASRVNPPDKSHRPVGHPKRPVGGRHARRVRSIRDSRERR
ncbi:hypothetical protein [Frigoribacterium sp. PhB118]|uniref:hypothetical protein n=1 Tax=Frigoribacterium sp. PhB118 TaxID=2485175 RepID=UPI0011CDA0D6|nr:hypothetical protein [Frigoribacterium sp. PhB118]